jgi:threonyl-tRNA synthetase
VLPVTEDQADYARRVVERLRAAGLRVELDDRNEKLGFRIRENRLQRLPYLLVVGEREAAEGTASAKRGKGQDLGAVALDELVERMVRDAAWPDPPQIEN